MTIALLALTLATQDYELIRRKERIEYEEAIDLCRKAEARIASEPAKAVELLTELIEKRPLRRMECTVRIEVFANAPDPPVALHPWQLRGRARQSLAKSAGENRRKLLEQALEDFEVSTAKGVASSADLARAVRRELLGVIRPLFETAQPPAANALLLRMEADGQGAEVEAFAEGLQKEAGAADRRLDVPGPVPQRQAAARREVAWCDAALAALAGTRAGKEAKAALSGVRERAAAIAAYRGSIRIKISASPYAEIVSLKRDGKEVPLEERLTPLALPAPVEIGDLEIELSHPAAGKRTAKFAASSLREGATYVLTADMEKGVLALTPLP